MFLKSLYNLPSTQGFKPATLKVNEKTGYDRSYTMTLGTVGLSGSRKEELSQLSCC